MIVQLFTIVTAVLSVVNSQQPQGATFPQSVNGLQYSQQGLNPGNLFATHQQALAYNQQAYPQPGAAYSNQQVFPQPAQAQPSFTPQPHNSIYNGHYATQQGLPQSAILNTQLPAPQQHVTQPFPSVAQANLVRNTAPNKAPAGASLLGVSFSSTADASQVRFSGPGVSFSY